MGSRQVQNKVHIRLSQRPMWLNLLYNYFKTSLYRHISRYDHWTSQNVSHCCSQCMFYRGVVLMRITHHSVVWFPRKFITTCQTSKQALLLPPCYTTWLKSNYFPLSQQLMNGISMSNKDQWLHQRPRILPHKIKNILILWVNLFPPKHQTVRKRFTVTRLACDKKKLNFLDYN